MFTYGTHELQSHARCVRALRLFWNAFLLASRAHAISNLGIHYARVNSFTFTRTWRFHILHAMLNILKQPPPPGQERRVGVPGNGFCNRGFRVRCRRKVLNTAIANKAPALTSAPRHPRRLPPNMPRRRLGEYVVHIEVLGATAAHEATFLR